MPASSQQRLFRVAIIGGGLGGLACALAIHHHCSKTGAPIQIEVYEQTSEYKEIGAGVGLGVNAARLLHNIGIGAQLNEISGNRRGGWVSFRRYDNSEDIITVQGAPEAFIREAPCARSDLLDLLKKAVEARQAAALHTSKVCVNVEEHGDKTIIHFQDGTTVEANMVVGCDGIHSVVRNRFVDDRPVYSGTIAYRGVVPTASLTGWPFNTYSLCWIGKGKHFLVYPIARNEQLNIVAFAPRDESELANAKESWTSVCERHDVETDFKDFDKPVQQIISLMDKKPSKWQLNDRLPLKQWHFLEGKVVLLGDAAHAVLPHMGAGAGQAIEDTWVLGRALSEYLAGSENPHFTTLQSTAQFYQDVRLPRAQKVQAESRVAGKTYDMQTDEMLDKSFEECIPLVAASTRQRMQWVWEEDLDASYNNMRDRLSG